MKRSALLIAAAILMCLPALAAERDSNVSAIRDRLADHTVICGDFTQSKYLQALSRPLVSKGRFVLSEEDGVLWHVVEPFPAKVMIQGDTLVRWNESGVPQPVNLSQAPLFRTLSQVIMAVFTGDFDLLRQTFDLESNLSPSLWTLELTPRSASLAAVVTDVQVSGQRYVDELTIAEAYGDQTHLSFTNMMTQSCELGELKNNGLAQ